MSHQGVLDESYWWLMAWNDAWFLNLPIGQFRFFWLWNDLWLSYINFHLSSFSNLTSGFTSGRFIFIINIISSAIKFRVVATVNLMPFITRASPVCEILFLVFIQISSQWIPYPMGPGPCIPDLILKPFLTATTSHSWLCIINKPRKGPSLVWIII